MSSATYCEQCAREMAWSHGNGGNYIRTPHTCNQPERSKREDLENKLVYIEPDVEKMSSSMKSKFEAAKKSLECGALNSMET